MHQVSEKIILTIWVGAMWAIGYIVTPVLFQMLDKPVAGNVAGQLFTIVNYIGLFSAVFLLATTFVKQNFNFKHWQLWLLMVMLLIIVFAQFVLHPMMAELKASGLTGENASQFSRLHGISSVLYLMNSLSGLVLVITGLEKSNI